MSPNWQELSESFFERFPTPWRVEDNYGATDLVAANGAHIDYMEYTGDKKQAWGFHAAVCNAVNAMREGGETPLVVRPYGYRKDDRTGWWQIYENDCAPRLLCYREKEADAKFIVDALNKAVAEQQGHD